MTSDFHGKFRHMGMSVLRLSDWCVVLTVPCIFFSNIFLNYGTCNRSGYILLLFQAKNQNI